MKLLIPIILTSLLTACGVRFEDPIPCVDTKVELIGYRVAKHSHLWVKDHSTGVVYDIGGLGGRREPSVPIGSIINVKVCGAHAYVDKAEYVRVPEDRTTRIVGQTN